LQLFAAFLDPRFKKLKPFLKRQDRELLRQGILEYIIAVEVDKAQNEIGQNRPPNPVMNQAPRRHRRGGVAQQHRAGIANMMMDLNGDSDEDEEDEQDERNHRRPVVDRNAIAAIVEAQLQRYEKEPLLPFWTSVDENDQPTDGAEYSDPLLWWKVKAALYPALAPLARVILAIPASSAPAERLFSHAGLTLAKDRSRLTPEVASDIIFLHDAYPLVFPQLMPPNPHFFL
jgi:hypothetical protein